MTKRRRGFLLRALVSAVLLLVLLVVAAAGAAALLVSPDTFKPEIVAAARRATGRELVLAGPIRIGFGLPPRLVAEDVAFTNPPGYSRPDMVTLHTLQARVALLPLLAGTVEIVSLDLVQPRLWLERDAQGRGNWDFMPPAPTGPGSAAGPSRHARLAIWAVHVRDGQVASHDARTGQSVQVQVPRFDAIANGANAPMLLSGDLIAAGHAWTLTGETGPVARLLDRADTRPWPVQAVLVGQGARLAVRGTIAQPLQGRGYALQVDAAATDLAPFAAWLPPPLAPGPPPALHDASFSARIGDAGGGRPELSGLTLHVAGLDLARWVPGLDLAQAEVTAPALAQPARTTLTGTFRGVPVHLAGTVGALAAFLPGAPSPMPTGPVPLDLDITAAGASASLRGTVAAPARLGGLALAVTAKVPDLAALAPLAGRPLPGWRDVTLAGKLGGDAGAGGTLTMQGFTVAAPPLEAHGDLSLASAGRPVLRGSVTATRLDLDPLLAGLRLPSPHPATAPTAPAPVAARPARRTRLIPDTPIDFARLRAADADLQLAAATLRTGGVTYTDVAGHLVLQDGDLTLAPLTGHAPGGALQARLTIDARQAAPPVALSLHAPALALAPLASVLGRPGEVAGTAVIDADLSATGATPQALAATLDGHLGLDVNDAVVPDAWLADLLGAVLRGARLPVNALKADAGEGTTKLRCLKLRLTAKDGVATITALSADTTRLSVQGSGTVNLGTEAMDLRLRPLLHLGPGIVVPVHLGGTLLAPKAVAEGFHGSLAGVLVGEKAEPQGCSVTAAVAAAAAPGQPAKPPKPPKPPKPIDILRALLGK